MDAALASYDQALRLFTEVGAKLGQANVYLAQGQLQNDMSLLERALRLYEEIRDRYSSARCKFFLGIHCLQNGDSERGVRLLLEARETWEQIDFTQGVQAVDAVLGQFQDSAGNTPDE
jgi:tetratricopeptide (TPR) repeat protein